MHDPIPITLLALDVDGVLTDGSIMLDDHGVETKRFNAKDGQGVATWLSLGLSVAIITKRSGMAVQHRARELGIPHVIQGAPDKSAALDDLLARTGLAAHQVAYVGDDWPDLAPMRRVGYPIAVADAAAHVAAQAAYVTRAPGGRGAVREAVEHLLKAKGLLEAAVARF